MFSAAYTNSYIPTNVTLNYYADMGNSTDTGRTNYSFNMAARQRFVIVVHGISAGFSGDYKLLVTGGSCRPLLKMDKIAGNRVAFDWSTAAVGYNLQQTNRLPNPLTPNWIPPSPAPVIVNSRFRLTNTMSPSNGFYKLRRP